MNNLLRLGLYVFPLLAVKKYELAEFYSLQFNLNQIFPF